LCCAAEVARHHPVRSSFEEPAPSSPLMGAVRDGVR
jgi:hypothetical protein